MNVLFRDDDVMFHLVGFSKVPIRGFFFGAILWFQKVGKNFPIFSQFAFQIYIARTKSFEYFC
jgi:hypothetical protein